MNRRALPTLVLLLLLGACNAMRNAPYTRRTISTKPGTYYIEAVWQGWHSGRPQAIALRREATHACYTIGAETADIRALKVWRVDDGTTRGGVLVTCDGSWLSHKTSSR